MIKSLPLSYPINDFYNWFKRKELILQPKFQRRHVWIPKAKSFLIDTILRNIPIPKLYMRQTIDVENGTTIREIVDGQQRLSAVFEYLDNEFSVLKSHNSEYGGLLYKELPEHERESFLSYLFSVDLLEGADDIEVLEVFSRINSYTITLNPQEKLNAQFFGDFKQCVYKLGHEHYKFWLNNSILTDMNVARMAEAELVTELTIAMLGGINSKKANVIREYYKKYDDKFSPKLRITARFRSIIDIIARIFPEGLKNTLFKRIPLFYSLFLVLYDGIYGLPNSRRKRFRISSSRYPNVRRELLMLDSEMKRTQVASKLIPLVKASSRGTTNADSRLLRHKYIYDVIYKALS